VVNIIPYTTEIVDAAPLRLFHSFPLSLSHSSAKPGGHGVFNIIPYTTEIVDAVPLRLFHSFPLSLSHSSPLSLPPSFTLSLFPETRWARRV